MTLTTATAPVKTANKGRRVTTLAMRLALNWPRAVTPSARLDADIARGLDILASAREDDEICWENAAFIGLVLARHRGAVDNDCPDVSMEMDAFDLLGAAIRAV